jgi:hypothetical protein
MASLQIIVIVFRERLQSGLGNFFFILRLGGFINDGLGWGQGGCFDKEELIVTRQLAGQPQERLFEIVIRLCRNVVVLEILFAVESNLLGLDFTVLDFHLVASQDNGNVFAANPRQIAMPVGDIFVRDARRDIKHDNGALALNVVSIAQTTKLFLTSRVPDVELDGSAIGKKEQGVDFDTQSRHVLSFEFTRQMTLDKGRFTDASVAQHNELEFGNVLMFLRRS